MENILLTEEDYQRALDSKILICTPSPGEVQATFAYDLGYLMRESGAAFVLSLGSQLSSLRSGLIKYAKETGASHVLFIDSDMRFPSNTIVRLLARRKDVVGANCRVRTTEDEVWTGRTVDGFISSAGKKGVEEVDTLGFGVTLIDMKIFEEVEEPLFAMPWDGEKYVGEDIFFCLKIKKAGFSIWVDHDFSQEVRHTASIEKGVNDQTQH